MRINGHNVLAIILAAVVMYGIGGAIYGFLFTQQWQQMTGITGMVAPGEEWRMAIGPILPLLLAIGLSLVIKWRGAAGPMGGAATGFWMALFFVFATNLYNLAYYNVNPGVTGIDALHLFSINLIGGAIIGAWK